MGGRVQKKERKRNCIFSFTGMQESEALGNAMSQVTVVVLDLLITIGEYICLF